MRKVLKIMLTIGCASLINGSNAAPLFQPILSKNEGPTTFLGPTLQGTYAGWMSNYSAYSLLGELAPKNYRLGLTAGFKLTEFQRIKFSAEYLWQRLNYSFYTGQTQQWAQQGAIGADYQYYLNGAYLQALELDLYGSHAPNKTLHSVAGANLSNRIVTDFLNNRRIAGSNAGGAGAGVNFALWRDSLAGVDLNWDDVRYTKAYANSEHATGFGGTVHLEQKMGHHASIFVLASRRKPFNAYQGKLSWDNFNWNGRWSAGIFGAYTSGKEGLSNSYNLGLSLSYFADCLTTELPKNLKGELVPYKNEASVTVPSDPTFLNWTTEPAVYMPQVLTVADENVRPTCAIGGVSSFGIVARQFALGPGSVVSVATAQLFAGNDLTYSVSFTPALSNGDTIVINPATGEVTGRVGTVFPPAHDTSYTVTVTASNACGSASAAPFIMELDF